MLSVIILANFCFCRRIIDQRNSHMGPMGSCPSLPALLARKHSSMMRYVCQRYVLQSPDVSTGGEEVGLQVKMFEQVSSDDHQGQVGTMSDVWGEQSWRVPCLMYRGRLGGCTVRFNTSWVMSHGDPLPL